MNALKNRVRSRKLRLVSPGRLDPHVDPFALVLFGGLAAFVLAVWLLGRLYPGSGLDQLGLRSARQITETREALEAEDLEQMVAARNARRRARGESEVSAGEVEAQVLAEMARHRARVASGRAQADSAWERAGADAAPGRAGADAARERADADRDLDELLELSNARRRARGLPERTREQALEEFGRARGGPAGAGSVEGGSVEGGSVEGGSVEGGSVEGGSVEGGSGGSGSGESG
jgi:hypothetical protein